MTTFHYGCGDCTDKDREISELREKLKLAESVVARHHEVVATKEEGIRIIAGLRRELALLGSELADRGASFARERAFANALHDLVPDVLFGGRVPIPDFAAYARVALSAGFDLYWAVDWIRAGYPEPPVWLVPKVEGRATEYSTCEHPRQVTPDQQILPCAQPGCPHSRGVPGYGFIRTMRLRRDLLPYVAYSKSKEYELTPAVTEEAWERSPEFTRGGRSYRFWIPVAL
jgi:hypothetical protein